MVRAYGSIRDFCFFLTERMVVLSPAEILNSSQSYEAIAAQMCTREIAEGVDSPDQFLMALFSKMLLTREEVESLRMDLQFTSLKEKRDKNFYIMLKVHRKISEDSRLFFNLCGALEDIYYFRFKKTLYGMNIFKYLANGYDNYILGTFQML